MLEKWHKIVKEKCEGISSKNCLTLFGSREEKLRCDKYGEVCWFYWFSEKSPSNHELKELENLTKLAKSEKFLVRKMLNRGQNPLDKITWQSEEFTEWQVVEHGITYKLKTNQGLSPGLFLDQSQNRKWVLEHSTNATVLNLFAYTGSFGLCATKGGAKEVQNIDTSKTTLDWAKDNAELNSLEMSYYHNDARSFVKRALKKERKFDLIICDPPSFARSKKEIWKIEKDLALLINNLDKICAPNGKILYVSNFEKWNYEKFTDVISTNSPNGTVEICPSVQSSYFHTKHCIVSY